MTYNPDLHRRKSCRLRNYDYSRCGAYFVTLCIWQKECLLGNIVDGVITLNEYGRLVEKEWIRTEVIRPYVEIDAYVVMPNHFHGIVITKRKGVSQYAPTNDFRSPSQTIGAIVRGFKAGVTKLVNTNRNTIGMPVWQRNYYEHIVRDEKDLARIRQYIIENPAKWNLDENNPVNNQNGIISRRVSK